MRSLWLASAAFCLTAGVAMAQTTSSAPAPTGAPNGAAASPAPGAAPGNMAPGHDAGGTSGAMSPMSPMSTGSAAGTVSSGGMSAGSSGGMAAGSSGGMAAGSSGGVAASAPTSPEATGGLTKGTSSTASASSHYNGQDSISPAAGQAGSEGNSARTVTTGSMGMNAPAEQQTASSSLGGGTRMSHATAGYGETARLPANAGPDAYLGIASRAIKSHDKALADDALSHAETRLLTRAVPASSGATADDSPGVSAIEQARAALRSGDYAGAESATRAAMHVHHGMMGEDGMNGGSAPGAGAMGGPTQ